jgi:hypothetical protein
MDHVRVAAGQGSSSRLDDGEISKLLERSSGMLRALVAVYTCSRWPNSNSFDIVVWHLSSNEELAADKMYPSGESITTTIPPFGGRIATTLEESRVDQEESQSPATAARLVGLFEKHRGFGHGHERRGRCHKLCQSGLLWWVVVTLQT